MTTHKLLLRILVGVSAVVVAGVLLDSSLPGTARIVGVCAIALICWAYWARLLPPG